jgi:Gpi18-like mannosyltransferase
VALAAILVLAVAARALALQVPGHWGDLEVMARWAENLAQFGPRAFYEHDNAIYPSLLPVLWPLGVLLDGEPLRAAIKGLSIPFDLLIGILLYAVVARRTRVAMGLLAAAVYLFNPAVLVAGPMWGQVDAAGTLFFLGALVALAADRYVVAGALAVLAGLAKPQFGLVALPLAVVVVQQLWHGRTWRPMLAAALGGGLAALGVGLFLGLAPGTWVGLVVGASQFQPLTSLSAFNVWALIVGFEIPDASYVGIGAVLLVAGLAAAQIPLRRGHDLATVLAVGLMVAFAFYFLPTRVHERYLFPALALAAPFAAVDRAALAAYVSLSLGFALSLLRAMVLTTHLPVDRALADLLTAPITVWVIGLILIGSALTLVRIVLSGAGDALAPRSVSAGRG